MDTSISTNEIEQIPDNSTQLSTTHVQTPTKGSSNPPPMATPNSKKSSFLSRRKSKTVPTIDTSADKKNSINVENERDELLKLIHSDISYIKDAIEKVDSYNKDATEKVDKYTDFVKSQIEEVSQNLKKLNNMGGIEHYREQKKIVTKLKLKLKVPPKHSDAKYPNRNKQSYLSSKSKDAIDAKLFDKILQLYRTTIFENSPPFQDFEVRYNQLELELKLCLLCFSVFPENVIIKKRLIVYWWIGEGFINPETDEKTEEDHANELFHRLIELGFIEPIPKKRGNTIDRCKMHPFVRSSLIILAKRDKFFDFNEKGDATEGFSTSFRSCSSGKGLVNIPYLGKLHMLFNLDEGFLEFKRESFSKMRNINVLCLGKWQESATHHVLAEGTEFLNGLDSMNHLKLFSLQGVCQITEIPKSISSLSTLKILDLRACHNLQVINGGIGFLKNLTHLDMSQCYSLDQMPKELSSLLSLQVLKGFVVGHSTTKHSCTIADLAKLPKLKKLSIHSGSVEFPSKSELEELQKFPLLSKLTIAWGRGSSQQEDKEKTNPKQAKDGAKSQAETKTRAGDGGKSQDGAETSSKREKDGAQSQGETKTSSKDGEKSQDSAETSSKQEKDGAQSQGETKTSSEDGEKSQDGAETSSKQEKDGAKSQGETKTSSKDGEKSQESAETSSKQEKDGAKSEVETKTSPEGGEKSQNGAETSSKQEKDRAKAQGETKTSSKDGVKSQDGAEASSKQEKDGSKSQGETKSSSKDGEKSQNGGETSSKQEKDRAKGQGETKTTSKDGEKSQDGAEASSKQEKDGAKSQGETKRSSEDGEKSQNGAETSSKQERDRAKLQGEAKTTSKDGEKSQDSAKTSSKQEKDGTKSQGQTKTSSKQAKNGAKSASKSATLPRQLEKLDLQCFPKPMAPEWLKPANLKGLERLYIRGGKLCDLGHFPELIEDGKSVLVKKEGWGVQRLRLKYLDEMEMDWRGLQELFPKLVYLEKVKCPKLTFFPCDESGVWIERAMEGK